MGHITKFITFMSGLDGGQINLSQYLRKCLLHQFRVKLAVCDGPRFECEDIENSKYAWQLAQQISLEHLLVKTGTHFHSFSNEHQRLFRTIWSSSSRPNHDINWFLSLEMYSDTFQNVSWASDAKPIILVADHRIHSEKFVRLNEEFVFGTPPRLQWFFSLCTTVFTWRHLKATVVVASCMVWAPKPSSSIGFCRLEAFWHLSECFLGEWCQLYRLGRWPQHPQWKTRPTKRRICLRHAKYFPLPFDPAVFTCRHLRATLVVASCMIWAPKISLFNSS